MESTSKPIDTKNKPLKFFQPFNLLVTMSFFSPLIVAIIITSLSFVFQNFKGLIYLGFLIAGCLIRETLYYVNGAKPLLEDGSICNSIQYSKYGNASLIFHSVFTVVAPTASRAISQLPPEFLVVILRFGTNP